MNNNELPKKSPYQKVNLFFLFLGILISFFVLDLIFLNRDVETIPYSQFLQMLKRNEVSDLVISQDQISGRSISADTKKFFVTYSMSDPHLLEQLRASDLSFRAMPRTNFWSNVFTWALPLASLYLLWRISSPRFSGLRSGSLLGLGKSKAKIFTETKITTNFDDVAGVDEAKEELREIVSFIQNAKNIARLGGRLPKGILLVGPPGTGKTLLAKALAGETKVPFISINGSEFVEMFVGLGAARVRDLFQTAREMAPCILFIDEIDALGRARLFGTPYSGANEEKDQTLQQLLVEMDGFDTSQGVVILAATNRPETLDQALLRSGRFDRQVLVALPDQAGRIQILKVHAKKIKIDPRTNFDAIASLTTGFSGADLANLVNEAAITATRRNAEIVVENDFVTALERIVAGLEYKKKVIPADQKQRIAYHEIGHVTAALALQSQERVHKVSVIPRGMGALGYTLQLPREDHYLLKEDELMTKISILLGGRAAEEKFLGSISTGAADDLVKATNIARSMVVQYGMCPKLGLMVYEQRRNPFLVSEPLSGIVPVSEETSFLIDQEIRERLGFCYKRAVEAIGGNSTFIKMAVEKLLELETLSESQIQEIWQKNQISKTIVPTAILEV